MMKDGIRKYERVLVFAPASVVFRLRFPIRFTEKSCWKRATQAGLMEVSAVVEPGSLAFAWEPIYQLSKRDLVLVSLIAGAKTRTLSSIRMPSFIKSVRSSSGELKPL